MLHGPVRSTRQSGYMADSMQVLNQGGYANLVSRPGLFSRFYPV